MSLADVLPFLVPLILIELLLLAVALKHILTHKEYKHGNRMLWIVIVVLGMNIIGPVLYFIFGKEDS